MKKMVEQRVECLSSEGWHNNQILPSELLSVPGDLIYFAPANQIFKPA